MSYSSTNPALMFLDGLNATAPRLFLYASTHYSTDIAATGFFQGAGAGGVRAGGGNIGMRVGDLVLCTLTAQSSLGLPQGAVTMHSVINVTANSSGYAPNYDATVSPLTT